GASDNLFPRLLNPDYRNEADGEVFDTNGPAPFGVEDNTDYGAPGGVVDSDPRTISNLIVDMTPNNPAAIRVALRAAGSENIEVDAQAVFDAYQAINNAAPPAKPAAQAAFDALAQTLGLNITKSPGLDGDFGTADDKDVFVITNTTPDEGLSAGFNSWFVFFGQFFDHGLDLVTKGGNETIYIPLQPDDPLYVEGGHTNFMVLTRATTFETAGADGILGNDPSTLVDESADNTIEHQNTTSPFVDQNQTYSSHPSHQVFLRAYEMTPGGPVDTGRLITNRDLVDGIFGNGNDVEIGGMATWAVVKAQARDILGINLTDADVGNVPLLATDAYGNFIRGDNGFPQVVLQAAFVNDPILDPDGNGL